MSTTTRNENASAPHVPASEIGRDGEQSRARYPDSVNLQQAMLFPGGGRGGRGFSAGPSAGGVTIDQSMMNQLPVARSFYNLARIAPGVTNDNVGSTVLGSSGGVVRRRRSAMN